MAHVHEEDRSTYYTEQLCTIGICAALGGVALALGPRGMLDLILAPKFHLPVTLGGYALLALAAIRAVALWRSVGRPGESAAHHHDHDHEPGHDHSQTHAVTAEPDVHSHEAGEACDNDHGHCHDHDHGHDHSWNPLRYVFLMLPVVLFFLNLPNEGLKATEEQDVQGLGDSQEITTMAASTVALGASPTGMGPFSVFAEFIAGQPKEVISLEFKELDAVAYDPQRRADYQGHLGRLQGQLAHTANERVFSLVRYKMTCCAADATAVRVVIVAPSSVASIPQNQWVEVEGQIQFRQRPGHAGEVMPVLQVLLMNKIRKIPPLPSIYLNN